MPFPESATLRRRMVGCRRARASSGELEGAPVARPTVVSEKRASSAAGSSACAKHLRSAAAEGCARTRSVETLLHVSDVYLWPGARAGELEFMPAGGQDRTGQDADPITVRSEARGAITPGGAYAPLKNK